jgi:hypothetical protein
MRSCRGIAAMAPRSACFCFRLFCRPNNAFLAHKSEMSFSDLEPKQCYDLSKYRLVNPYIRGEFFGFSADSCLSSSISSQAGSTFCDSRVKNTLTTGFLEKGPSRHLRRRRRHARGFSMVNGCRPRIGHPGCRPRIGHPARQQSALKSTVPTVLHPCHSIRATPLFAAHNTLTPPMSAPGGLARHFLGNASPNEMPAMSSRKQSPPNHMARHRAVRRAMASASTKMPRRLCLLGAMTD